MRSLLESKKLPTATSPHCAQTLGYIRMPFTVLLAPGGMASGVPAGCHSSNSRKAAMAPRPPPTAYMLMLRLCQDTVSPLDGVTPSCCPKPLLQLATQCCARDPEERPSLAAVLEQLHGKVLRSIDEAAYSAGVGARRPLTALEGWLDAAERIFFGAEPAAQRCSRASRSCAHRPAPAPTTESESLQC